MKYLSDTQLAARYAISRSSVWRWAARGILPAPVQLSPGTTRWRADEVEVCDAAREAARTKAA